MMSGLILRTSSSSMPSRRRAAGKKLVRNTSLVRISSCRTCNAPGCSSARPMLRLPRLGCSIKGAKDPLPTGMPIRSLRPRWASPFSACSTLMTSAPQSAKTAPAAGTKVNCATSSTRTPSIGRITTSPLRFHFRLGASQLAPATGQLLAGRTWTTSIITSRGRVMTSCSTSATVAEVRRWVPLIRVR